MIKYAALGLGAAIIFEIFSEASDKLFPHNPGQSLFARWLLMGAVAGGLLYVGSKA